MSKLMLDSLEIKNFRAFKHLRIEKLGRVNLIVGKNNVGKSSLLEALWLYARRGDPALVWHILGMRDEVDSLSSGMPATIAKRLSAAASLFHGRATISEHNYPTLIHIGSISEPQDELFFIGVLMLAAASTGDGRKVVTGAGFGEIELEDDLTPALSVGYGNKAIHTYPLTSIASQTVTYKLGKRDVNCIYISAQGASNDQIVALWDSTTLTGLEENVLTSLRLIDPGVERINLVGSDDASATRHPIVKARTLDDPFPLRSMGEGMNRMFGIALALVNAKDGMLLIDEVDTGLHYSVLPDLWNLIFEVAHRLNVQVFATTHSKDCIEAFQQAADENTEEKGVLVRLENRKAGVGAVTFDEQELAIVTREQIEVR